MKHCLNFIFAILLTLCSAMALADTIHPVTVTVYNRLPNQMINTVTMNGQLAHPEKFGSNIKINGSFKPQAIDVNPQSKGTFTIEQYQYQGSPQTTTIEFIVGENTGTYVDALLCLDAKAGLMISPMFATGSMGKYAISPVWIDAYHINIFIDSSVPMIG